MSGTHGNPRDNFLHNVLAGLLAATDRALNADTLASREGLLQRIDARVKLAGIMALILAVALSTKLGVIGAILALALSLSAMSRLPVAVMAPAWISALMFTGMIAIPAVFLTPGRSVLHFPNLNWDITDQGLTTASFLMLRVETSTTLALILVFTTPWTHVLKALRIFRVPAVFVVVLGMAFRYILLLLATAREMFESRTSRTVGRLSGCQYRRLAITSAGVLMSKTLQLSSEVYLAMQARGFRGEVYILDEFRMANRDWTALALFAAASAGAVWAGR